MEQSILSWSSQYFNGAINIFRKKSIFSMTPNWTLFYKVRIYYRLAAYTSMPENHQIWHSISSDMLNIVDT